MPTLPQLKVQQAVEILNEKDIDLWLTFVRETSVNPDPVLPLIYGDDSITRRSFLLIHKSGETIAIIARIDADTARNNGAYQQVLVSDASIRDLLLSTLDRLDPRSIAINISQSDVLADGLSVGLYQILLSLLKGTPYEERLVSAEAVIGALNGRKIPREVERIRDAVAETEAIYQVTYEFLKPGKTEIDVANFMHQQIKDRGLDVAWTYEGCPAVNSGPDSPVGHAAPGSIQLERGHIVHFDFGVKKSGFCSDIQRVVYLLKPGESQAPQAVQFGFDTVRKAVEAARSVMKPGVTGFEVDKAARQVIVEAGFPEYKYATGHQLGRHAHDGGGILGPDWEVYTGLVHTALEAGQVYTIEPGLAVPGYGYIGLEEDVVVTENGAVYLGEPQQAIILR
ncbi:MAG: peptidase M24 [Anaerolineaceae bacterium]|nr:peptidase M24 [Anaerolineaceae bacterium]